MRRLNDESGGLTDEAAIALRAATQPLEVLYGTEHDAWVRDASAPLGSRYAPGPVWEAAKVQVEANLKAFHAEFQDPPVLQVRPGVSFQ